MTAEPQGRGALLRGGGIVLAGLVAWNLGNYAFFLVAGRYLGPRDYGLLAALLAAMLVVAVPAQSLQFATARLLAAPPHGDRTVAEGIYQVVWRRCAATTVVGAGMACAAVAVAHALGWAERPGPLFATVALVAPLGFFFLALGRLQGDERFTAFSTCFALWGAPRPVVFVPLAVLGLGVYAGLGATGFAVLAAASAAAWLARRPRTFDRPAANEWRTFSRPLVPVVLGFTGLGILTNLDVIVAKAALAPERAGQFAAAAALAKAVFVIPQALSFVLLPRVAARSAAARETGLLLAVGVGATLLAGGVASLLLWLFSHPLLRITFGSKFEASSGLLGAYAGASTLVGALIIVINHHVGRRADRFAWATAALAFLQGILFLAFHDAAKTIIAVDAAVGAGGLVVHEYMFRRTREGIVGALVHVAQPARRRW